MSKSLFTKEYAAFLDLLKAARRRSGLSQMEVAQRLGETQSFVSKCERGERRLDVVEARAFCKAVGVSFVGLIAEFDREPGDEA
ncbi:MAG: helix-turn-helix transcriptional regulator [Armatimonadota bacterium]|nr:helix-turn-helix transcriptional regulator [Armatimonadota bacterium]